MSADEFGRKKAIEKGSLSRLEDVLQMIDWEYKIG